MADQSEKRQQFRFWYPFWGNSTTSRPSTPRASSSQTQPKTQSQPQPTPSDQFQPNKRISRTPSFAPSSSKQKQKQKERTPTQSPSRRAPRSTPSPSPTPTPTQSPSRESSQSDRGEEKRKDESPQPLRLTPSPSEDVHKPEEVSQEELAVKEAVEPKDGQKPKALEENRDQPTKEVTKVENDNSNLENLDSKPLSFDPLMGLKPNKTVISERNLIDDEKTRENHENISQTMEDLKPNEEIPKTQLEEKYDQTNGERTRNDDPISFTVIDQENLKETTKEENPKETIKEENLKENSESIDTNNRDANSKETTKEMEKSSQETPHILKPIVRGENEPPTNKKDEGQLPLESNNLNSNDKIGNIINSSNHKSIDESSNKNSEGTLSVENRNPNIKREMAENFPRRKEKPIASSSQTRPSFHKDIKQGISKLIQNINTGNPHNPSSENGIFIITLAGENKGASMYIGHKNDENSGFLGRARKLNENKAESSNQNCKNKEDEKDDKNSEISSNVNSNVQSINNSVMHGSSCDVRDPGVHFTLSNKVNNDKMKNKENEGSHLMKHK